uniref:tripartite tricarboxylate transporter permease n=1 Tax=Actinosynnema sp. TaxID=1872144 RepID=UPI003F84EC9F
YLYAGITMFAMLGVWATSSRVLDLVLVVAIGLLGFAMRRYGLPVAPVLIGVILGPLAETEFRRAMAVSGGDPAALVGSPIAIGLYSVLVLGVAGLLVQRARTRRRQEAQA